MVMAFHIFKEAKIEIFRDNLAFIIWDKEFL
jgi:hypothetical protein